MGSDRGHVDHRRESCCAASEMVKLRGKADVHSGAVTLPQHSQPEC